MAELEDLQGQSNEAKAYRQQAKELLDADSDSIVAHSLQSTLAFFLCASADYETAAAFFEKDLQRNWSEDTLFYRWLCLNLADAEPGRILESAREALGYVKGPKERAELLCDCARLEWLQGQFESSVAALQSALRHLGGLGKEARHLKKFALALALAVGGANRGADETLRSALAPEQDIEISVIVEAVNFLHDEGRFVDAQRLLDLSPQTPELLKTRGLVASELGERKMGLDHYQRALASLTQTENDFVRAGLAGSACFLFEEAKGYILKLSEAKSSSTLAEWACLHDGTPDLAKEFLSSVGKAKTPALYDGRFEECLEEARALSSGDGRAYASALADHYSANIMLYQERWAEALELYKGSVEFLSQDPVRQAMSRLYSLVCRSWLGEDVTSAIELSQASLLERFPNSPQMIAYTRFAVADAFYGAKDSERCLRQIELALATEPRAFYRGQLLEMKAASLRELGRVDEAREHYQMIGALIPESFVARRVQAVLQEMSE